MFRELFGLPAHALIVHAAVVFIPLAALALILYAVWPALRKHIWWAVVGLGVLAAASGWAARLSGEEYKKWWIEARGASGDFLAEIDRHQALGNPLAWWATALGVVALAVVLYAIPGPVALGRVAPAGSSTARLVEVVAAVVAVAVAAVALYYVIRTGDAGARISHADVDS